MFFSLLLCLFALFSPAVSYAQRAGASPQGNWPLLVGAEEGLLGLDWSGKSKVLWSGGSVRKILKIDGAWAIMGSGGILVSNDLSTWENRSRGLPVKTIKLFQDGRKTFLPVVQEIKDLEVNPLDTDIMVCATKDRVYLSRNQGRTWTSLGAPPYRTNGIKAVGAAYMSPGELTVFLSHSTYGIHYIQPGRSSQWTELNKGLEKLETTDNADEVSDIAVSLPASGGAPIIYASQTFRRRIYRLDWSTKTFALIWSDDSPFGTVDSLDPGKTSLRFIQEGAVAEINYSGGAQTAKQRPDLRDFVRSLPNSLNVEPHCFVMRENLNRRDSELISLSELWLLDEKAPDNSIAGREGLYLPVNHAMDPYSLKPYLDVISDRKLDMIVIDMKDDYGRLRFTPRNPAISKKGRVFRPLDIDAFLGDMKKKNIYTIARVVVFKDPEVAAREGGKYAVWDSKNGKPWVGYHDVRRKKSGVPANEDRREDLTAILPAEDPEYEILRTYYDERWVDPYSEEVWEYTAAVAEELHQRGFDEIQFDYIRFPTDGDNLWEARYRWQDSGMDMESAMLSFLRHIRSRVKAPISIDIYGANGWYRTGARTGQEVELLAPWVDVICPMYYPSHFEQDFLAQTPAEQRPYRIYYQGTLRTSRIGRGKVIVRPYVQAFYLNVSYDRKYYNADYVRLQVEGVRDAGSPGLTYWNNSGRYEDIPR